MAHLSEKNICNEQNKFLEHKHRRYVEQIKEYLNSLEAINEDSVLLNRKGEAILKQLLLEDNSQKPEDLSEEREEFRREESNSYLKLYHYHFNEFIKNFPQGHDYLSEAKIDDNDFILALIKEKKDFLLSFVIRIMPIDALKHYLPQISGYAEENKSEIVQKQLAKINEVSSSQLKL